MPIWRLADISGWCGNLVSQKEPSQKHRGQLSIPRRRGLIPIRGVLETVDFNRIESAWANAYGSLTPAPGLNEPGYIAQRQLKPSTGCGS